MRWVSLISIAVGLLVGGCEDDGHEPVSLVPEVLRDLYVCGPPDEWGVPGTCLPDDLQAYYTGVWIQEFRLRNGISVEWYDEHVIKLMAYSICSDNGSYFRVACRIAIDWVVIDIHNSFLVMLPDTANPVADLDLPRNEYFDLEEVRLVLDYRPYGWIEKVNPIEEVLYDSCIDAAMAFQDSVGSAEIAPFEIEYWVPGKLPREDGYPYFRGFGVIDDAENQCVRGWINLVTGEYEAHGTPCIIDH